MAKKKRTYYSIPRDYDIVSAATLCDEPSPWGITHMCPLTEGERERKAMLRAMGQGEPPGCPWPSLSYCEAVCGMQDWSELINKWANDWVDQMAKRIDSEILEDMKRSWTAPTP